MQKFANMQNLWDYRHGDNAGARQFLYHDGETGHAMAFNVNGDMVLHQILKSESQDFFALFTDGTMLGMNVPVTLIPAAFREAPLTETTTEQEQIPLSGDWVLSYPKNKAVPLLLPLFFLAKSKALQNKHYTLIHVHNNSVNVAAFSDGVPLLLNHFSAMNESEALYFALAPFKRAGIPVTEVVVEILTAENQLQPMLQLFGRFLSHVSAGKIDLPYPAGQYPPHSDISALMHLLPQCGLPEEA